MYHSFPSTGICDSSRACSKKDWKRYKTVTLQQGYTVVACFFEVLQNGINPGKDERDANLENIVHYLQISTKENSNDYAIIAYIAVYLFYMTHIAFYQKNPTLNNSIKQTERAY